MSREIVEFCRRGTYDFHLHNQDAMTRHDAAMYQLVDDLSDCADYHSMLMNGSGAPKAVQHVILFMSMQH